MIQNHLLLVLSLLFTISMLAILSSKIKISYPIFLVIAGLAISLIPGLPEIRVEPDFVFLIFLPPLLYAAAWNTSWNDFWKYKRPIGLLGFGLVIFTSATVAVVAHWLIPEFPIAYGFLLGGIISPPDAIAASSVLKDLKIPKRVSVILEGESLVNDAASIIVFRFALAAILTQEFHFWRATETFFIVALMGIGIGLAIGYIIYGIHHYFPTTPAIDTSITLISPYVMYIVAEHFHFSGVLAVVTGGLFLGFRSQDYFGYESRLQAEGLWETLIFLLNGFVFILIGLQLPAIVRGMDGYSIGTATGYAILISLLIIIIRLAWVFPAAHIPRMLIKRIRDTEPRPPDSGVFLIGWAGMRGIVSLAAALSIPLLLKEGTPFPHRNLILFVSFVVILITLVVQGLSLKTVIRLLKIESNEQVSGRKNALVMRVQMAEAVLSYLDTNYAGEIAGNEAYKRVRDRYERMIETSKKRIRGEEPEDDTNTFLPQYRQMLVELVKIRRLLIRQFRYKNEFEEELIKERERELDLEEARLST